MELHIFVILKKSYSLFVAYSKVAPWGQWYLLFFSFLFYAWHIPDTESLLVNAYMKYQWLEDHIQMQLQLTLLLWWCSKWLKFLDRLQNEVDNTFFRRFYLFDRTQAGGRVEREGEAGSLLSWEPDMGLHPRTPDHEPSQRQTLNQVSHPVALK